MLKTRKKTALDRGQTNHISLTHNLDLAYDLDLQSLQAMVMAYSQAKIRGQWSVTSEDKVKTNGQIEGDYITYRINAVGNYAITTCTYS